MINELFKQNALLLLFIIDSTEEAIKLNTFYKGVIYATLS